MKEKRVAQEKKKKNEKAGFTEIESSNRKALKMQAEAKQKEEEAKQRQKEEVHIDDIR